jgi:hypothetical protein
MINLSQGIDLISQEIKHIRKLQRMQFVSILVKYAHRSSENFH